MSVVAANFQRGPVASFALAVSAICLLAAGVFTPAPLVQMGPLAALLVALAFGHTVLLRWEVLLAGLLGVILFIPIKRYTLPSGLPFDLEPYRVCVALLLLAWALSLLVDHRVRIVKTGFEGPLAAIAVSVVGSEAVNLGRVTGLEATVVKSVTFFVSYVLVVYLIVSLVRTRERLHVLLRVLVAGGSVVAFTAVVENRTGFNVFNHLGNYVPVLAYHEVGEELRGGNIRAYASAQHPIALSVALLALIPFAVYLAKATEKRRWWLAAVLLLAGDLSTGSRTGALGLAVLALAYLFLRPAEVRRFWPALVPAVVAIHFLVPGALGGIKAGFFPAGGLIAEQSNVVRGDAQVQQLSNNRLADLGPSLREFSGYNPLFGEGFGTRVTGFDSPTINAAILDDQWLKTLLETGFVGILAWVWWFGRAVRRLSWEARRDHSPEGWLAVGLAASLLSVLVCMFTFDMFSFIQVTFILFILLAFASVVVRTGAGGEQRSQNRPR